MDKNKNQIIKYRGGVIPDNIVPKLLAGDYSFLQEQKIGYYLSYISQNLEFHAVDRFASFPLFYTILNRKLFVSEKIDDLLPYLPEIKFDPIGYYSTGGMIKGDRTEHTPFVGIKRILPGHYLEYKNKKIKLQCYWKFTDLKGKQFQGTYEEACEELGYLIQQGVERCFKFAPNAALHLSGGLDSGTVTAFICQLSNVKRYAYTHLDINAPLHHDIYESGFIGKYQKYYSHLEILRFDPSAYLEEETTILLDANNWNGISHQFVEFSIAEKVKSQGGKYILTGLGGDELASYGHGGQNVWYSIYNDKQAYIYNKWILDKYYTWRNLLNIALGRGKSPFLDVFYSSQMDKAIYENKSWYTSSFQKRAKSSFCSPSISLFSSPSSYNYRLETLERSFFTVRSDKWNYIGRQYGIDYLHPLLDADLVEFSARMPRDFFRNRKNREMIKTALNGRIPPALLKGNKRPVFNKKDLECKSVLLQIGIVREKLKTLKGSFASLVYDYNNILELLDQYEKRVMLTPASYSQTLGKVYKWLAYTNLVINRAAYLNHFF